MNSQIPSSIFLPNNVLIVLKITTLFLPFTVVLLDTNKTAQMKIILHLNLLRINKFPISQLPLNSFQTFPTIIGFQILLSKHCQKIKKNFLLKTILFVNHQNPFTMVSIVFHVLQGHILMLICWNADNVLQIPNTHLL